MAVSVVFKEGELSGSEEADDAVDGSVFEVVVVVGFFLPSPSLGLISFSVVLLDCIDSIARGFSCSPSFFF